MVKVFQVFAGLLQVHQNTQMALPLPLKRVGLPPHIVLEQWQSIGGKS
jgi:hypothetical protein